MSLASLYGTWTPAVGWAVVHSLWQCVALAALAAATMSAFRSASARYLVGLIAVGLMLVAPIATFFVCWQPAVETTLPRGAPAAFEVASAVTTRASAGAGAGYDLSLSPVLLDALAYLWLAGVAVLSLRLAGGWWWLERLRYQRHGEATPRLRRLLVEVQERVGVRRRVRLCQTLLLQTPAVIGCFKPLVLLPIAAITGLTESQLRSVLAHELAHIRRYDALANLGQAIVETLLFFHPAVWWLNRRVRQEREHCCDDIALAEADDPVSYARALAAIAEWEQAPVLAMAANRGSVAARAARVLGVARPSRPSGLRAPAGVLCLGIALALGASWVDRTPGHAATASATPAAMAAERSRPPGPKRGQPTEDDSDAVEDQDGDSGSSRQGYLTDLADLGALGLEPDAGELLAFRVHGVTVPWVRRLTALGLKLDAGKAIALRVHGATAEFVEAMQRRGATVTTDDVIAMRIHRATPDQLDELRDLGFEPTVGDLIALRVHGVTTADIEGLRAAGLTADLDAVINAGVQGVTVDFVEQARAAGFQVSNLNQLVQLKRLGVLDEGDDR